MSFYDIMERRRKTYSPFTCTVDTARKPRSLVDSIKMAQKKGVNPVIAEIKPASPTAGIIRKGVNAAELSAAYSACGACGISVLTEPEYFHGSMEMLKKACTCAAVPVLRKDFLFDVSQVGESYYYGADLLLLIASFFDVDGLASMIETSRDYGMEPLVEIHDRKDAETAISAGAKLIGINNRDKDTLEVDLRRTERLAPYVNGVTVSASGIETERQLAYVLKYCDAALVGSSLMRSEDAGESLKRLVYGGKR